ncbi:MAG: STAS domain-containing protein [Gluconacetobacter diazotrophicus]|nr:STAS domain-containing protein [Gluconacetobacter diazotrophicus]
MTDPRPDTFLLPGHLGQATAGTLAAALLERRGRSLRLDGSAAGPLGAGCLQVMLAAERSWRQENLDLRIIDASADLLSSLALLGIAADSTLLQPECDR